MVKGGRWHWRLARLWRDPKISRNRGDPGKVDYLRLMCYFKKLFPLSSLEIIWSVNGYDRLLSVVIKTLYVAPVYQWTILKNKGDMIHFAQVPGQSRSALWAKRIGVSVCPETSPAAHEYILNLCLNTNLTHKDPKVPWRFWCFVINIQAYYVG